MDATTTEVVGLPSPVKSNELQLTYHGPSQDYMVTRQPFA
jgi:hypothetical protein